MNFDLSPEQASLRDSARAFLAARWSADEMRRALDAGPAAIPAALWAEIAAMGWIGIASAQEIGGGGGGGDLVTAAILAEEAGRALLPGPFLSALAAGIAVEDSGDDRLRRSLLPDLYAGRRRGTVAPAEPAPGCEPVTAGAGADGQGAQGDWTLRGSTVLVPDASGAAWMLVAARTPDGAALFLVPGDAVGLAVTPMHRLDAQAVAEVRLDGVRVPREDVLAPACHDRALDAWAALYAADLLGTAQRLVEMTASYARERVQFGRPIGSFQAVSHRLADALVDVEIGRGLVYGACLALDDRRPNAPALASAAKAWASDAAVRAAETALQLHGGMGYTWEFDVHLYLRRARANAATLGDADHHRDRIAALVGPEMGPEMEDR